MTAVARILIVDDHPVVLFGLRVLFSDDPSRVVIGEAPDKARALRSTALARPDVIILDLMLGGRDGIELMRELLAIHSAARVVVYSSQDERVFAPRVLQAGGSGYVAKSEDLSIVAKAVDAVTEGRLFFSTRVSALLLRQAARVRPSDNPYETLSNRELQVFRLIGEGRSSQEIADQLQLSIKTVGTYRERLKIKLHLENTRDLERTAFGYAGAQRP
jgi:DNA-binding NarL/FixJ family response regulator